MPAQNLQLHMDNALKAAHLHILAIAKLQSAAAGRDRWLSDLDFQKMKIEQKGWEDEMEKHRLASIALLKLKNLIGAELSD